MKCATVFLVLVTQLFVLDAQEILPMVKVKDQPIITGWLNGKRAHFLIDTGSDISLLNGKAERKYKFQIREMSMRDYQLSGLNSISRGKMCFAYNVNFSLGREEVKTNFRVLDLTHIVNAISDDTGISISGIIGSDLMKKHDFVIDYGAREIRFSQR